MAIKIGKQLYGLSRLFIKLKMSQNIALKGLSLKTKLAIGDFIDESKITRIGKEYYINTITPFYPSKAFDRFNKNMIGYTKGKRIPNVVDFAVTSKCPCKCWHCSYADRLNTDAKENLSLEEVKRIISEIQDLGAPFIALTGGEPLMRNDLEEIIAHIDDRSIPVLFTTGYKLTHDRVKKLKQAGLKMPIISLDHYNPEVFEKARGVKGLFDYAVKAIEFFQKEDVYTSISFVPTKKIINDPVELEKCFNFFKELGVNDIRITTPKLSGNLRDKKEEGFSVKDLEIVYQWQKKCVKTKGYPSCLAFDYFEREELIGCGAGFYLTYIDSRGNVCPCDYIESLSFGNLKEESLKDIWSRMGDCFKKVGCSCYNPKLSMHIKNISPDQFPLNAKESMKICQKYPSYSNRIPKFLLNISENREGAVK